MAYTEAHTYAAAWSVKGGKYPRLTLNVKKKKDPLFAWKSIHSQMEVFDELYNAAWQILLVGTWSCSAHEVGVALDEWAQTLSGRVLPFFLLKVLAAT